MSTFHLRDRVGKLISYLTTKGGNPAVAICFHNGRRKGQVNKSQRVINDTLPHLPSFRIPDAFVYVVRNRCQKGQNILIPLFS